MSQDLLVPNISPSPKQAKFLSSDAYETFFGGAAGPGKSAALCAEAVTSCLEDPGHHTYIFRKTIPELKQSIVPEIKKQCAAYLDHMPYNSQDRRFNFPNGSYIQLAYCDNPGDYFRYQSAEIHTLLFDELTHFTQDEYEYLKTRVRSVEPRLLRVMSASNPGNVGHGWVKSYFIDIAQEGTIYTDPGTGLTRMFIPAVIDDHPIESFRIQYRKTLESIPDPDLRKALLNGDWSIFAGQVYTEWRRNIHVINKLPIELQDCHRFIGLDWGYNDPTSIHWIAEAPKKDGITHYYIYRELYGNGKRPEEWALILARHMQLEPVDILLMPHDTFDNLGGTRPIVDQFKDIFNKLGLQVRIDRSAPATHTAKINRQSLIHDMLAIQEDGLPKMQVMSNCVNLIRTLPMLPYSTTRVEEIDDKADDHCLAGDTLVDTENGLIPIKDLVGTSGRLWSLGELKKYHSVRQTGTEVLYKLTFNDGQIVRCSADHLFLTTQGWVKAIDLTSQTMILLHNESKHINANMSGVQRLKVLSNGQKILSTYRQATQRFKVIAQRCLGVSQRSDISQLPHSSYRSGSFKQSDRQLANVKPTRAFNWTHVYSRSIRTKEKTHTDNSGKSKSLALFTRRKRVAQTTLRENENQSSQTIPTQRSIFDLYCLWQKLYRKISFRKSLQRKVYISLSLRIREEESPVYNLEVEDTHCFTVNDGITVHNCYDSLSYGLYYINYSRENAEVINEPTAESYKYKSATSNEINDIIKEALRSQNNPEQDWRYI